MTKTECLAAIDGFNQGFDLSNSMTASLVIVVLLFLFGMRLIDRREYPIAPTLAELERRHKYLGLLIERKKKSIQKPLKNHA